MKKYQLKDLIEKIEEVDEMIKLHSSNTSPFMLGQYEAKKQKLLQYFIEELLHTQIKKAYSFRLINLAINKYNSGTILSEKGVKDKDWKDLEALLC